MNYDSDFGFNGHPYMLPIVEVMGAIAPAIENADREAL